MKSMADNINPEYYKDGPFECIKLSRLLTSDWGQVVQYCFRWKDKNGIEDLEKALWFAEDAVKTDMPFYAIRFKKDEQGYHFIDSFDLATKYLWQLMSCNWADLGVVWDAMMRQELDDIVMILKEEIKHARFVEAVSNGKDQRVSLAE